MMSPRRFLMLAALSATPASCAFAGPVWCEPVAGEAGSFPSSANITKGTGPVAVLKGILNGLPPRTARGVPVADGDFQDMYRIRIVNPSVFVASTSPNFPSAFATFDSELYLFDAQGRGVLANLNDPNDPAGAATIGPDSNDGSGVLLTQPGIYFLAISGVASRPVNPAGINIFAFDDPFEVSGPDGVPVGGDRTIDSWSQPGEIGDYQIILEGASFAEHPCPGDCDLDGRVNFNDLVCMLGEFGLPFVESDCDGDGTTNFNDLVCALGRFGPCNDQTVPPDQSSDNS